ncbi:MAG: hypothetical protein JO043_01225 [Candidatus Eremiobacteraeota bacterium]|nr:hypothetical protein [Candidatus Eremiobacteraeota bacterium]
MSFFDNVASAVSHWFGGDVTVEDAVKAARTSIREMDAGELVAQLEQSVASFDQPSRAALGAHILRTLKQQPGDATTDADFATQAGTTNEAVATGSPQALSALIEAARTQPDALRAAFANFIDATPGAVTKLSPGLTAGIKSRLDFQ